MKKYEPTAIEFEAMYLAEKMKNKSKCLIKPITSVTMYNYLQVYLIRI